MADISSIGASSSAYASRPTRIDRLFAKADGDGDGKLSIGEFQSIGQKTPGQAATTAGADATNPADLFKKIDSDGDGSVTKDEMKTYQDQQVAQMRSAMLNLQEMFGAGSQHAMGEKAMLDLKAGAPSHRHHHKADQATSAVANGQGTSTADAGDSTDVVTALMKMLDTSNDGSISKDELSAFLQKKSAQAA
jgi:Ca2+-binding EF-hand superfamily protein